MALTRPIVPAPLAEQAIVQGLENLQNTVAGFKDVFREEMAQVRADFRSLEKKVDADFRSLEKKVNKITEKVDGLTEDVKKMKSELTTVTQFTNAQRIEKAVVCIFEILSHLPNCIPSPRFISDFMPFSNRT